MITTFKQMRPSLTLFTPSSFFLSPFSFQQKFFPSRKWLFTSVLSSSPLQVQLPHAGILHKSALVVAVAFPVYIDDQPKLGYWGWAHLIHTIIWEFGHCSLTIPWSSENRYIVHRWKEKYCIRKVCLFACLRLVETENKMRKRIKRTLFIYLFLTWNKCMHYCSPSCYKKSFLISTKWTNSSFPLFLKYPFKGPEAGFIYSSPCTSRSIIAFCNLVPFQNRRRFLAVIAYWFLYFLMY